MPFKETLSRTKTLDISKILNPCQLQHYSKYFFLVKGFPRRFSVQTILTEVGGKIEAQHFESYPKKLPYKLAVQNQHQLKEKLLTTMSKPGF